jgi:surface polysaccharide O-acyltransferase-like enzyme
MKNTEYINKLRVFATLMVIMLHVSAPVRDQLENMNALNWFIGSLFDGFSRAGVPLFLMISGALLLNKKESLKDFYVKRLLRILIPFLFWGLFYGFYWTKSVGKELNVTETLLSVFKGPTSYHLWYLYTIIGIYLVSPFLRILIENITKTQLQILLILGLIFNILLPHIYSEFYIWFKTDLKLGFQLPMIDVYLWYFILGFYLQKYFSPSKKANFYLFAYIFTSVITVFLGYLVYVHDKTYNPLFILNESPFVFLQATFIYLHFKRKNFEEKNKQSKIISTLNFLSFGLYLIHPFLIDLFDKGFLGFALHAKKMDTILSIPLSFLTIVITSTVVCWIISKIPIFKKTII